MDSGMVSKIEKARRYAEERERVRFEQFQVAFHGEHSDHVVSYQKGAWRCDCRFFGQRGVCSHTMALERILAGMLTEQNPAAELGA